MNFAIFLAIVKPESYFSQVVAYTEVKSIDTVEINSIDVIVLSYQPAAWLSSAF